MTYPVSAFHIYLWPCVSCTTMHIVNPLPIEGSRNLKNQSENNDENNNGDNNRNNTNLAPTLARM